jgi:hypothetical protein
LFYSWRPAIAIFQMIQHRLIIIRFHISFIFANWRSRVPFVYLSEINASVNGIGALIFLGRYR